MEIDKEPELLAEGGDGDEEEEEEQDNIEFLGKAPKKKDKRITYMGKSISNLV